MSCRRLSTTCRDWTPCVTSSRHSARRRWAPRPPLQGRPTLNTPTNDGVDAGSGQLLGRFRVPVKSNARVLFRRPGGYSRLVRIKQKLGAQARRSDHETRTADADGCRDRTDGHSLRNLAADCSSAIGGIPQRPPPGVPPLTRVSRSRSAPWPHARPPDGHCTASKRPRWSSRKQQKTGSRTCKKESPLAPNRGPTHCDA